MDAYAQSGLRTLVVAYKVISIEEYDKMEYEIHKAAVSLSSQKSEVIILLMVHFINRLILNLIIAY